MRDSRSTSRTRLQTPSPRHVASELRVCPLWAGCVSVPCRLQGPRAGRPFPQGFLTFRTVQSEPLTALNLGSSFQGCRAVASSGSYRSHRSPEQRPGEPNVQRPRGSVPHRRRTEAGGSRHLRAACETREECRELWAGLPHACAGARRTA